MKIVIAGASGFVGSNLSSFFKERGYDLILLSRHPKEGETFWDPKEKKMELSCLENADVVINLSGENIFGRWSKQKLEKIQESRFIPTEFLTESFLKLKNPPSLFINASAVGYYGDRGDEILTEDKSAGMGYLAEICKKWEEIPKKLSSTNIRLVFSRFGIVLGQNGGILQKVKIPFKLGLGGKLSSGRQYMSWIAIDDLLLAMEHVIQHKELSGPINFCSPKPVTNKEFTKALSHTFKTPALLDVPGGMISFLFGKGKEMFLASTRAIPKKLLDTGYAFQYPDLESALKKYLSI